MGRRRFRFFRLRRNSLEYLFGLPPTFWERLYALLTKGVKGYRKWLERETSFPLFREPRSSPHQKREGRG